MPDPIAQVGLRSGPRRYEAIWIDARHARAELALLVGDSREPWQVAWAGPTRVLARDELRRGVATTKTEVG
jgi:hypothetical protein